MDKASNESRQLNHLESPQQIRSKANKSIQEFRQKLMLKDAIGVKTLDNHLQDQANFARADAAIEKTQPINTQFYEKLLAGTIEDKRGFCNTRVEQLIKDASEHDQQAANGNPNAAKFAEEERLEAGGWLVLGGTIN